MSLNFIFTNLLLTFEHQRIFYKLIFTRCLSVKLRNNYKKDSTPSIINSLKVNSNLERFQLIFSKKNNNNNIIIITNINIILLILIFLL